MIPALGRHLVESTLFASVVALFPFLMRKRAAASRHAVWLLAASKFVLPAALFSAAGIELRAFFPLRQALLASSAALSNFLPPPNSASFDTGAIGKTSYLLLAVWLGGAAALLAIWILRLFAKRDSSAATPDSENETLVRMQRQVGLRRPVGLRTSKARGSPCITGVWKLTITIPEGLSQVLAPRELEAVLLHELAHAKRRDNLSSGFVHALACLFWFHPLLWWIERRLIVEQELACDEMVLCSGAKREEYVGGILKVCQFHFSEALPGTCGVAVSDIKKRMEAIMLYQPKPYRTPRLLIGALAGIMTMVPLSLGFFSSTATYGQNSKAGRPASARATSRPALTCDYSGKAYPMGSVIQTRAGDRPLTGERLCVEDPQGHPLWVATNAAARERSQHVIPLPPEPPEPRVVCEPVPSPSPKYCACQNAGIFSLGAIVDSANGKLRCDKGKWRAATPAELGLTGKN
ncbi:MAG TPA: M56 family metallopeptidase [Terriglobia bacterium]|nr:M56 family metallopeptidase [Terriglobia bacterium]